MALPISIPYSFQTATSALPLSQLDTNFATVQAAINSMGNGTFAMSNVQITGGTIGGLSAPIAVGSGGTGYNSLTANSLLAGNGNSAVQLIAPGTSGNVLYSNGTAWISTAFIPQPGSNGNVITSNGTAWISQAGGLPTVSGNNGKVLKTDGSATSWSSAPNLGTALAYNWNGLSNNATLDFTSIPSWVKRITVICNAISANGGSDLLVQIGAGSVTNTGYVSTSAGSLGAGATVNGTSSNVGFVMYSSTGSQTYSGFMSLINISGNVWVSSHTFGSDAGGGRNLWTSGGGIVTLSGVLDRVRIASTNATQVFDAGSVNIMWE